MLDTSPVSTPRASGRVGGIVPWLVVAAIFAARAVLTEGRPAADDPAAALVAAYFRVHPDLALGRGGPPESIALRPLGRELLEWRDTLRNTLRRLEREEDRPGPTLARRRALRSWVEGELLRLEGLATVRTDPETYVTHARRLLEGLRETPGLSVEQRRQAWDDALAGIPAFLKEARISLIDPNRTAIDRALLELERLEALLARPGGSAPDDEEVSADDPRTAIARFRLWLQRTRERVASEPLRLGADWGRYARLVTGTALGSREIKAHLLRELAALDGPFALTAAQRALVSIPAETLERGFTTTSANALALARVLEVLGPGPGPDRLHVDTRESPSDEIQCVVPGWSNGREEELLLLLPSETWSAERSAERLSAFFPKPLTALALRHGMAGEGLYSVVTRDDPRPFASTVLREPLRIGFGLFALDWIPQLAHEDSPFVDDPELTRAIAAHQALEVARLLATLELHAEGLSVEEALVGFLRRTEVDPDQGRAEVERALVDPAHGMGALVRLELRELEERMQRLLGPGKALPRLLKLLLANPDLRPSDLPDAL